MPLRPLFVVGLCAGLAACGGGGVGDVTRPPKDMSCPRGTPELRVRDVLPQPPAGLELVPSDKKDAARVIAELKRRLGERVKNIRSGVVLKPGRQYGTGLFVINVNERMGDPREVFVGSQASARDVGGNVEELTIAGVPGALVTASGGAQATVAIGDCAALILVGPNEPAVRRVAAEVRKPA